MATKRMLIDASHPEETRVVVVDGNKLDDYDVEVASRRQLKGNIYLAKVTRVEPSLQAAFVDYGGNRHGFLAFNEIHPDYYQIPVADRERLLAEQAAEHAAESADREHGEEEDGESAVDDEEDVERRRPRPPSRYYKIQEVVKRRQIMLVQVAKEERGNKGAALTTYLSLAGRYCVLMPNTSRGGGISRKIGGVNDRKRLKKILADLDVPDGMAVIVRTAGAGRGKAEVKRDYEYLVRLWSSIRELTLKSTAPALVYEEASLIKRSIRDLYDRDIEEIIVQGEEEYRTAKEFMKLFISSHAKRVKLYENSDKPLFQQFGVEDALDAIHQPIVQLRSGGYIVVNPTEALVAIDVNSGRSTRERNIEETALRTNLEAADEIARQLRLRDHAGLIVVDFIDMENPRNQALVERRLKEAMKTDRARVQLGRISPFGLLELSRQRLRPSLIETSFEVCPSCHGMGIRRTTESTTLAILRKLEEEGAKQRANVLSVALPPAVAMYLLNQKRRSLQSIEDRYGLSISITSDEMLVPPDHRIERIKVAGVRPEEEGATAEMEEEAEAEEVAQAATADREEARRGRRRRSRRRRRQDEGAPGEVFASTDAEPGEEAEDEGIEPAEAEADAGEDDAEALEGAAATDEAADRPARKRRRRGKRGGRRRGREGAQPLAAELPADAAAEALEADAAPFADWDAQPPADEYEQEEDEREVPAEDVPALAVAQDLLADEAGEVPPGIAAEGERAGPEAEDAGPAPRKRTRRRAAATGTTPRRRRTKAAAEEAPAVEAPAAEPEFADLVAEDEPLPEKAAELASLPEEAGVGDADAEPAVAMVETAFEVEEVGGSVPPLPDDEGAPDEALSDEQAPGDAVDAGEDSRSRAAAEDAATAREDEDLAGVQPVEAQPTAEPVPLHAYADAGPELAAAERQPAASAVGGDGYAPPPPEPVGQAAEGPDQESVSEAERLAQEVRRTEVIRVGEQDAPEADDSRRRGWWQRLLS